MDEISGWLGSSVGVTVVVTGLTAVAFATDRLLKRLGRAVEHRRTHAHRGADGRGGAAAALAHRAARLGGPGVLVGRAVVWLALAWAAGEISPSLRFARSFVSVVGRTAITAPVVMLGERGWSVLDFVELPIAIAVAWLVINALSRLVESRLARHERVDTGTRHAVTLLGRCALACVAALVILHAWGVDVRSLTIAASVVGVGVGFGLQNITSNFVSGLLVSFERPIRPGDFVKVGELTGTVERIGLRCTEIITLDRVSILVPNSQFLEKEVVNWSHGDPVYRLHVPVNVAYDSDVARVRAALLEAAETHRAVLRDPSARVEFHGFGDSALRFELLVWARDPKHQYHLLSDLNYRVEASLRRHDIHIPYPQHDVHLRSPELERLIAALSDDTARSSVRANGGRNRRRHGSSPAAAAESRAREAMELDAGRYDGDEAGAGGDSPCTTLGVSGDGRVESADADAAAVLAGAFDEVHDADAWTNAELEALGARMRARGGVAVADRRHRLRVHERCFVGSEAVDWLTAKLGISRKEAVALGRLLVSCGAVHHVVHEQPFRDGYFFYRFRGDEAASRAVA